MGQSPAALGRTEAARRRAYAAWVRSGMAEDELAFLRLAAQRGQRTGDASFGAKVARRIGRPIEFRGPGRPRKTRQEGEK